MYNDLANDQLESKQFLSFSNVTVKMYKKRRMGFLSDGASGHEIRHIEKNFLILETIFLVFV